MIKRDFNAFFINSVINHPSVRGGAGVQLGADVSALIRDTRNFVLCSEFGGFVVIQKTNQTYECHTQFLPEGRGGHVIASVVEAMLYMFTKTDCLRIVTKAHKDNPAALRLSRMFFTERGITGDYHYFDLGYHEWAGRSEACLLEGESFHNLVAEETNHDDDDAHDYQVGGALLIAKTGNIHKAQNVYNEWAVMSGYEPMILTSLNPPVAVIGDMMVTIENGSVMLCQ